MLSIKPSGPSLVDIVVRSADGSDIHGTLRDGETFSCGATKAELAAAIERLSEFEYGLRLALGPADPRIR